MRAVKPTLSLAWLTCTTYVVRSNFNPSQLEPAWAAVQPMQGRLIVRHWRTWGQHSEYEYVSRASDDEIKTINILA